jgi:FAD dependent oxidoreductase TIGR03364
MPGWLHERHGFELRFGTTVNAIEMPWLRTTDGQVWHVNRVIVASGIDFETLYPAIFAASGIRRCKLQMMRTCPQPGGWRLGPLVAFGLTLAFYPAFRICRSLPVLCDRIAATMPEYVRFGIHVMASQTASGEVVLGDSHEYDDAIEPFDKAEIERLILDYLKPRLRLPDGAIAERWHGIYARHPTLPLYTPEPQPGVAIISACGGKGMTMSFSYAEDWWDAL